MEFKSTTQIAKKASVPTSSVTNALKKLGYLNKYNRPTNKAVGLYKIKHFCGKEYPLWNQEVIDEVYDYLQERMWQ